MILPSEYLSRHSTIAIAVSGGADSMALLLLAQAWAQENNGKTIALTVDHGLRPEAADEASQVSKWCKEYGIEHHTLKWEHTPPSTGEGPGGGLYTEPLSPKCPPPNLPPNGEGITQNAARIARYQLLTDWCKAHHISHLLTAHHRDDQVETLFMRLSRGSFIDGLACIAPVTHAHGIRIVRPLLELSKAELIACLQSRNQRWIEDPTNASPRYTRNRLRTLLTDENIKTRAANVIATFAKTRRIIDRHVEEALASCIQHTAEYTILLLAPYRALPPEIAWRVCAQLIQMLTHTDHPPRTEKLLRLTESIQSGTLTKPRTLGGLVFAPLKNGRELHIYKERTV